MKLLAILFLFLPLFISAQQISNQKNFNVFSKNFGGLYFINDGEQLLAISSFQGAFIVDATSTEKIAEIKLLKNGETCIHPDGKTVCVVGQQYYDKPNKKMYMSVLQLVDTETGEMDIMYFEKKQMQRIQFHPTNDNLIAAIMMDENFEYQSVLIDLSTKKIQNVCLQGKGAFIPLTNDFTPDGKHLICGYGNSSYNGGFTLYDLEAKKEIKRISIKDQPLNFLFLEDKIIMRGNRSLRIYDKDWVEVKNIPLRIAAIHPSGKFGVHFNMEKEVYFVDLANGQKTKLDIPILKDQDFSNLSKFYGYATFSADGSTLAVKFYKWNKFKDTEMPDQPSFMTFEVTQ